MKKPDTYALRRLAWHIRRKGGMFQVWRLTQWGFAADDLI